MSASDCMGWIRAKSLDIFSSFFLFIDEYILVNCKECIKVN